MKPTHYSFLGIVAALVFFVSSVGFSQDQKSNLRRVLEGKVICLDPGHGGTAATDQYRVGPTGEREEWINLRVARMLQRMLKKSGAKVLMTRTEDVSISLADRAALAVANQADMFISIHHNATADRSVNFPIIYFHGSSEENRAGVVLGKLIGESFRRTLFSDEGPLSVVSDFAIFPNSGAGVLRGTYGIPAVIAEASFFSHAPEEARLKRNVYNRKEAKAYMKAISEYFSIEEAMPIEEKVQPMQLAPFQVFQEAERMSPEAMNWMGNFTEGKRIVDEGLEDDFERALTQLTVSVRSFPDSPVAGEAHQYRAMILEAMGKPTEAEEERLRRKYFYPVFEHLR
ncbi:MAG: N-acetylmuramoyl-L-alanine amidase [Lunatimonas sp.]|uniref:N-acetylmuramoyl-L-alanine amidase n=1 Tax=Lunatimonas sp. TaxID=2060141 RepID=UPI00263AD5DF|nr:N-acetylmuramoyl-L-alanine amidase [Lunatimonas sp.]MCC5938556.1 N-acetylmuramoyl-L-alanine amidase [Lunatimonas sp.]